MSIKRDYKSSSGWNRKKKNKRSQIRRNGLLVGVLVLIGLSASLLAYIREEFRQPPVTTSTPKEPVRTVTRSTEPEALPPLSKPKYDFYTVLPEREVVISKEEVKQHSNKAKKPQTKKTSKERIPAKPSKTTKAVKPAKTAKTAKTTTSKKSATGYLVQAGAFSKYADADRVKARLALLGIRARIEVGKSSSGKTLHRVRIGPIQGNQQTQALRQRLQKNNIPSIAIVVR